MSGVHITLLRDIAALPVLSDAGSGRWQVFNHRISD
jgi:hypothetical protein